jgi:hypothetical protein
LSIDVDIETIAAGSDARESFVQAFSLDMASLLGVDVSRIVVESIHSGSVLLTFVVFPDSDGTAVDSAALVQTVVAALDTATFGGYRATSPPEITADAVDECASNPCRNGAVCTESGTDTAVPVGTYRCTCMAGFANGWCDYDYAVEYALQCNVSNSGPSGELSGNCDTDVDECLSSPCANGAECFDSSLIQAAQRMFPRMRSRALVLRVMQTAAAHTATSPSMIICATSLRGDCATSTWTSVRAHRV